MPANDSSSTTTGSSPTGTFWRRDDRGRDSWVLRRREASPRPVSATRIFDDLEADAEVPTAPVDGWQDFLRRLALGVRRAAAARPEAVPGLLSQPPAGSRLLPPLTSAPWAERLLVALTDEGFDDEQAVTAYRAFATFLAGQLWTELPPRGALSRRSTVVGPGLTSPALRRLDDACSERTSTMEFEDALDHLLGRFEAMRDSDRSRAGGRQVASPPNLSVVAAT